jgi:hypothetical protein
LWGEELLDWVEKFNLVVLLDVNSTHLKKRVSIMLKNQRITAFVFLAALLIVGLLTTCSKNPKCWGEDKNTGIIKEAIRIDCMPFTGQQFIITDDSTYQETFATTCSLPAIDFNAYTLLGLYTEGSCELKFIRNVAQKDSENKYHYKVTVKDCGTCKKQAYSYNWGTVPKLPSGWNVSFEIKQQ